MSLLPNENCHFSAVSSKSGANAILLAAHWTLLSDPGRKVQKDLDIAEYKDPEHDPIIPHSSYWNLSTSVSGKLAQMRPPIQSARNDPGTVFPQRVKSLGYALLH